MNGNGNAGWKNYLWCIIGGTALLVNVFFLLFSTGFGLVLLTTFSPLYLAGIILSERKTRHPETRKSGFLGVIICLVGLVGIWAFLFLYITASLFEMIRHLP